MISGKNGGGILGAVEGSNTRALLKQPTVATGVAGSESAGGLIGSVGAGSAVELSGNISITQDATGTTKGSIIGKQSEALVYLSEVGETGNGNSQLNSVTSSSLDEVGNYGGIFRNMSEGSGKLIGDGTLAGVGRINHTVGGSGFTLTSAADFICLAIALNSQGNFGRTAFGNAEVSALLAGSYTVAPAGSENQTIDLSYTKTGIVTLNRNDSESADKAFSGSMQGTARTVTITKTIANRQDNLGLFSTIAGSGNGDSGVFKNLILQGEITLTNKAGGLAYQTKGTGLSLQNFATEVIMSDINECGGVLAKEDAGSSTKFALQASDITLGAVINAGTAGNYSGFITSLKNANVKLENITLGGSLTSTASGDLGGFLGKKWEQTDGILNHVTVKTDTSYNASRGTFGVLIGSASNQNGGSRLIMNDVKLDHLTVNANTAKSNCALLVQNAQDLVLEVIDYDASGCVVNTPGAYFDEIAGKTFADNNKIASGIVSIHSSAANFPAYHYENKVASLSGITNGETMYFYDLFQTVESTDVSGNSIVNENSRIAGNVLDTTGKVLLWDAVHYAKSGVVRDTFKKYYTGETIPAFANETITLSGNLNVSGISFYPVPGISNGTINGTGAVVTFGSKTTGNASMRDWKLPNHVNTSEHYRLQSGLLWKPAGTLTVTGLTFAGTAVCLDGATSGALVNGAVAGGTFTDITLRNLFLDGYTNDGSGLLISSIPGGTATFTGIGMTGYSNGGSTKAAAALIGSAGSATATDLVLTFRNMKIADVGAAGIAGGVSHNGDVFQYASFLNSYTYTDDTNANRGSGIHWFTYEDGHTNDDVTFGSELDGSTEYEDTTQFVITDLAITPGNYLPYVRGVKQIEVNPKAGDITTGCGTYEDPYRIGTMQQFLTLYRYLNEPSETVNAKNYTNWQVNAIGSDAAFCDGTHPAVAIGNAGFPTPLQMSRAYYMLTADIDLSVITGGNYGVIAGDFTGFGTAERPFTGVWYGRKTDGGNYSITLPSKNATNQILPTYGFIQYAKGAVVKDITINIPAEAAANADTGAKQSATRVNGTFGGVFAYITGGDNIVDNVTVSGPVRLQSNAVIAGGYAGTLQKGSLILRNVSGDNLAGVRLLTAGGDILNATSGANYLRIGALAGRVEDGYILYENSGNTDKPLWQGTNGTDGVLTDINWSAGNILLCKNYNIINGDWLSAQGKMSASGTSSVTADGLDYQKTDVTLPGNAALMVMAMALNSDSLSVSPSAGAYGGGYTELSRSRKAAYSNIGNCTSTTSDYVSAARNDNCMGYADTNADRAYAYPFIYNYMTLTGDFTNYAVTNGATDLWSIWNTYIPLNGTVYRTNYNLTGSSYDMRVFGDSFRGIGAIYQTGTNDGDQMNGSVFRGDFYGNNAIIRLDLNRKALASDTSSVKYAGLFPVLNGQGTTHGGAVHNDIYSKAGSYHIENMRLSGNIGGANGYVSVSAGGIAGIMIGGQFGLKDIREDNSFAIGTTGAGQNGVSMFGGMIGYVRGDVALTLDSCTLTGIPGSSVVLKGTGSGGGLIGQQGSEIAINNVDMPMVTIKNAGVSYLDLHSTNGNAAGLLGFAATGTANTAVQATPISMTDSYCRNTKVHGYWQAGGLLGENRIAVTITGTTLVAAAMPTVSESSIESFNNAGGMIGECRTVRNSRIQDVIVRDVTISETTGSGSSTQGGVIGLNAHNLSLTNVTVLGTGTDSCLITARSDKNRDNGAGGILGGNTGALALDTCIVNKVTVRGDRNSIDYGNGTVAAGGMIGYSRGAVTLNNTISIVNPKISVPMTGENVKTNQGHIVAAGGFMGYAGNTVKALTGDYYNGLTITNPSVTGKQAGGAFGYINSEVRLKGILIEATGTGDASAGSITSDDNAGGFAGRVYSSALALNDFTDQTENKINNLVINGRNAGGVLGDVTSNGIVRLNGLLVTGCTIKGSVVKPSETRGTSVGGVIGTMVTSGTGNSVRVYGAQVKNNTITAETSENSLLNNTLTDGSYAVGGLLGREYDNSKGLFYNDNIQLTDNVIGMTESGQADVKLVGKDLKL